MLEITSAAQNYCDNQPELSQILSKVTEQAWHIDVVLDITACKAGCHSSQRLALEVPDGIANKPFYVDWVAMRHRMHRVQHYQWQGEQLLQMLGKQAITLIDATLGFGRDSFILAAAGHQIIGFEQNPLIALLLADAMQINYEDERVNQIVQRVCLHTSTYAAQAIGGHIGTTSGPLSSYAKIGALYIDPMFASARQKKSKNEKYTQLLQYLNSPTHMDSTDEHSHLGSLEYMLAESRVILSHAVNAMIIVKQAEADTREALDWLNIDAAGKKFHCTNKIKGKGFRLSAYKPR